MRRPVLSLFFCGALTLLVSVRAATAEPIGTFKWQLQPFCNIVTLTVTHDSGVYTLDGFDDQCGAARRGPVVGIAVPNPNGSIGLGLTIISTPGGEPTHIDAVIDLGTLSGTWTDGAAGDGAFVFNGPGGGAPRPSGVSALTRFSTSPSLLGRRANGTPAGPLPVPSGQGLLTIGGRGYDGAGFTATSSQILLSALENWTPNAHGSRITFSTTPIGSTTMASRVTIDHDGRVGIGTTAPNAPLQVRGDIRVGANAVGCVEDNDGTVIAGVCASDARFKRDIASFEPMLGKVAALRPVHFYWRSSEFPARAFGERESYGLLAQEVEDVLPELVVTDDEGYKAVNYSKLPLVALQAIKELKADHDARTSALERRLAELEGELKRLRDR